MTVKDYSLNQLRKNIPTQSFEELADYIISNSNHNTNKSSKRVHIIVLYHNLEWNEFHRYLTTLTWFTGIGWNNRGSVDCNVIFTRDLDEALNKANDYDYAMISYTGTFYQSYQQNSPETIGDYFDKFCNSNIVCRGHLLFHPSKKYGRLHLQCMFMNLEHWRKIGKPKVTSAYSGPVMLPQRSEGNVHDDYTPFWIKPSEKWSEVKKWHMGEYITKVLEDGQKILNFDLERTCKFFTYPEREEISDMLLLERNRKENIVYVKNNEKLKKYDKLPDRKYDVIYSPASGEMSEFLFYKFGHENTKLVIYDYNSISLKWKQFLYQSVNTPQDIAKVSNYIGQKYDCYIDNVDYRESVVKENLEIFSDEKWIDIMKNANNVEFVECDVVNDILQIDETKTNFIAFSNIFSYMFLLHKMPIEDIHNSLLRYYKLDNTIIVGKNVFKDPFINDNICS